MRYRVATAFFARPTVFTRIKHTQNPNNVSLSSASKQKEEFEEIAKSVYREILRACAGKRRVKLSSTSKAKTEEEAIKIYEKKGYSDDQVYREKFIESQFCEIEEVK